MIFKGKIPVAPEVQKLHEHFKKPSKGDEFTHNEICEIINVKHDSNRYRTITDTWRRQVFRMYGIVIDAIPSVGFRSLIDSETLKYSDKHLKSSGMKLKKARDAAISINSEKLNTDERNYLDNRLAGYSKLLNYHALEERRKLDK